jgi:hypothetical protein
VSELQIYEAYLGSFKVGAIYNSPFRKDSNPSFGVFYSKSKDKLLFKDYGSGICGNIVKLISLLTGLTDHSDILFDITKKLHVTAKTTLNESKVYIPTPDLDIGIVRQPSTEEDIKYWAQFNIDKPTLELFNVSSIKYYLSNGVVRATYKADNPMYAYKVNEHFKIYRPYAQKTYKWRNNLTPDDAQGYEQLPAKGDTLFITKSLKDVMCLHSFGYSAISPSSESSRLSDTVMKAILKRFKRIIILFDRDACGVRESRTMSLKTGLRAILVHKKLKAKDISDAVKLNGPKKVKEWLENAIKE